MPRPILAAAALAAALAAPAAADDPSRYAAACELAARTALVGSMEFILKEVADGTAAGTPQVDVAFDAKSKSSGRIYPEVFTCQFVDLADPANIRLAAALQSGRPYAPAALNALNTVLRLNGFAPAP